MYFTFAWFDKARMLASGKSATIPFTSGKSLKMVPSKFVSDSRSRGPGAWLYCTTTTACVAFDACRSGDNFELSAYARVTVASKQMTRNFFIDPNPSAGAQV